MTINTYYHLMDKIYKKKTPYLVIELLESFTKKELERLDRFCNSIYFNTDKYATKLLSILVKKILHKEIDNNILHFRIYSSLFDDLPQPGKKSLDKKQKALLNAKMSALTKLAERFLTVEALENSDKNRCELLLDALFEKKQFRLHKKHIKKEGTGLNSKFIDYEYFDILYLLEDQKLQDAYYNGRWIKDDNLNDVTRSLDLMYLSKKLTYTIAGLSYNRVKAHKKYDQSIIEHLNTGFFDHINYKKYPSIILNIANAQLMINESRKAYEDLLELLEKYGDKISNFYINSYYNVAITFCIEQIKKGKTEYYTQYVELTKKLEEKNLLFTNAFSIQKLKNIVMIGCRANEFDWVIEIIENSRPHINKPIRKEVMNYNLGFVAFQKKEYEKCIEHLLEVDNFSISYDLSKRFILLKSYYELDKHYQEPTAQVFRSIEIFVLRNKLINSKDKKYHKNFINLAYNLYRYKHREGKMNLDKLKAKLENAELISNKAWLKEKIEELAHRKRFI